MHLGLIFDDHLKDERETKTLIISFLFGLIGYGDSSYARGLEHRKFVMEYCYFINKVVVS